MTRRNWRESETALLMQCAEEGMGLAMAQKVLAENGWERTISSMSGKYYREMGHTFPQETIEVKTVDEELPEIRYGRQLEPEVVEDIMIDDGEYGNMTYMMEDINRKGDLVRNLFLLLLVGVAVGLGWYNGL
mgnify:CR=1 FL=1|tara:strand:- start:12458 stop:12853 length:396 start_codon:yes stop_codon:yes gene_type:complete